MSKVTACEKVMVPVQEGIHIEGTGKEDYQKGNIMGEVKIRKAPVTKLEPKILITEKCIKDFKKNNLLLS